MAKHFLVVEGADKDRHFPLGENGIIVIGTSHRHAEICLHDMHAARSHCEVELDGDQVTVVDLDSDTGTFVNGVRVTRQELKPGDVLAVGDTKLCLKAGDFVRKKHVEEADSGKAYGMSEPPDPLAALANTDLAHYHLEALVGRGHTGAVYRARDQKTGHVVALKVLPAEFPKTEEEKQRFSTAVKAMLPLRHPNLVTLLGAGKAHAHCWLALEYVEGGSVAAVMKHLGEAGLPDWRDALRVALHVARALDFAHGHQVVHANVTPANVLIQKKDKSARLNDLILARALWGSQLGQAVFQKKFVAELAYVSPEQTHGPAHADSASDIYGLGATVYGLLTGRPPFQGPTPQEIVKKIRKVPPTPPRQVKPNVPESFEGVLLKMLAKSPDDRYDTGADLVAELEGIAAQAGVPA
jgi:serine/threonine protein kinase